MNTHRDNGRQYTHLQNSIQNRWIRTFNSIQFIFYSPISQITNVPLRDFTIYKHKTSLSQDLTTDQEKLPRNRKNPFTGNKGKKATVCVCVCVCVCVDASVLEPYWAHFAVSLPTFTCVCGWSVKCGFMWEVLCRGVSWCWWTDKGLFPQRPLVCDATAARRSAAAPRSTKSWRVPNRAKQSGSRARSHFRTLGAGRGWEALWWDGIPTVEEQRTKNNGCFLVGQPVLSLWSGLKYLNNQWMADHNMFLRWPFEEESSAPWRCRVFPVEPPTGGHFLKLVGLPWNLESWYLRCFDQCWLHEGAGGDNKATLTTKPKRSHSNDIQFNSVHFISSIIINYKFALKGFKICTHTTSLSQDLTSDQEQLPRNSYSISWE